MLMKKYILNNLSTSLLSQYFSKIIHIIITIITGPLVARYLGPEKFGKYSYVMAYIIIFLPFIDFGVRDILPVQLSKIREKSTLINTALCLRIFGQIIVSFIFIILSLLSNDLEISILFLISISYIFLQYADIYDVELLEIRKGFNLAKVNLVADIGYLFLLVLGILSGAKLYLFGLFLSLKNLIRILLFNKLNFSKIKRNSLRLFDKKIAKDLLRLGLPLLYANISIVLLTRSDQLMIQFFLGPKDLGEYSSVVKISEGLFFFQTILNQTYLPIINKGTLVFNTNNDLRNFYKLSWVIGMSLTISSLIFFPYIFKFLYGKEYYAAIPSLLALSPSLFAVSIGSANSLWLKCINKGSLLAQRSFISFFINLLMNFYLIPKYGILGAAISTTFAHFFGVIWVNIFNSNLTRQNLYKTFFPF